MRAFIVCLLTVGTLVALPTAAAGAQGQPSISISPQEGPPGTVLAVTGEGFAPGDTVYIEVFPGISLDHGAVPLETIAANDVGRFDIRAGMPPEGFENWGRVGGQYTVMAYPSSFGNRTRETVEAAPKAIFALTPGVWPSSGVGAGLTQKESLRTWVLASLGLAAGLSGAAAIMFLTVRRGA
jgi:hypothetical protein